MNVLLKIPAFRKVLVYRAFHLTYIDEDAWSKLEYKFSDSTGKKYYAYIRPEFMPLTRYEQMQIRLQEMEARIGRESLKLFTEACVKAAEKNDLLTVARLMAELQERVEVLYDPVLLMRFLSGIYIREDQVKTAYVWNQNIEDEKYERLMSDNADGKLGFFFQKSSLFDHVKYLDGSNTELEKLFHPTLVEGQMKEVKMFDKMLKEVKQAISKGR